MGEFLLAEGAHIADLPSPHIAIALAKPCQGRGQCEGLADLRYETPPPARTPQELQKSSPGQAFPSPRQAFPSPRQTLPRERAMGRLGEGLERLGQGSSFGVLSEEFFWSSSEFLWSSCWRRGLISQICQALTLPSPLARFV